MNALTVDPVTGYTQSGTSEFTFNAQKKQELLSLARDIVENHHEYPNIGDLCRVMKITVRTFQNHLATDEKFAEDWRELELKGEATYLSDMYSLRKKNPMYMFGWLRARLPEKYDTSRKIEINTDVSWMKNLIESFKPSVIATEAEVIPPKSK